MVLVGGNELDGFLSIAGGERVLVGRCFDDFLIAQQGQRRRGGFAAASFLRRLFGRRVRSDSHVIGVGQTEVVVEAAPGGQEFRLVTEVPLADGHRGVALLFQQPGHGMFLGAQPGGAGGKDNQGHRDPFGIAPGHHLGPRRGADRRGIKAGQFHPLGGHAVQIRRAVEFRVEGANVAIAHIVNQDDNEIRFWRVGGLSRGRLTEQGAEDSERAGDVSQCSHRGGRSMDGLRTGVKPGNLAPIGRRH